MDYEISYHVTIYLVQQQQEGKIELNLIENPEKPVNCESWHSSAKVSKKKSGKRTVGEMQPVKERRGDR